MPELAKSQRVRRIEHILVANHLARRPALTLRELAGRFDNSEMTIRRDVEELSRDIPLHIDRGRIIIDPGWDVPVQPVFLKLEEAAAVFLAARLLVRYSDEPNSAVVSALTILADALPHTIAEHVRRTSLLAAAEPDPQFAQVFSAITCGWAEQRRVRIHYRGVGSEEVQERVIHPYYIEPGPLGYSLYVIAHSEERDAVRVFKVERILEAELLADQFSLPADFDPLRYLAAAWGVMGPDYVGQEPITVKLHFKPAVTRRLRETRWHPTQQITTCEENGCPLARDGGCDLTVQVAETLEMIPWIKGWGSNVVVLEPAGLRDEIAADLGRSVANYPDLRNPASKLTESEKLVCYDKGRQVRRRGADHDHPVHRTPASRCGSSNHHRLRQQG